MKRPIAFFIALLILVVSFSSSSYAETVYEDPESDIRFTIPDGWINLPYLGEEEMYKVRYNYFKYNSDDYALFEYAFKDIYPTMPAEGQKKYSRKDIKNDFFSKSDIAALLNVWITTIEKETYAGIEYFTIKTAIEGEVKNGKVQPGRKGKILLRIDNGYLYMFSYSVSNVSPSKRTQECEGIIESIVYSASSVPVLQETSSPVVQNTLVPATANSKNTSVSNYSSTSSETMNPMAAMGLSIFTLVLIGIAAIVYVIHKRKKQGENEYQETISPQQPIENSHIITTPDIHSTGNVVPEAKEDNISEQEVNITKIDDESNFGCKSDVESDFRCEEEESPQSKTEIVLIPPESSLKDENDDAAEIVKFCRRCGNRLLPDSVFCDRCGTKIIK